MREDSVHSCGLSNLLYMLKDNVHSCEESSKAHRLLPTRKSIPAAGLMHQFKQTLEPQPLTPYICDSVCDNHEP